MKKKKEMIPLTNEKIRLMKSRKFATYIKKNLILMKMIKMHINNIIKSEILVMIQENLEGLLVVFSI